MIVITFILVVIVITVIIVTSIILLMAIIGSYTELVRMLERLRNLDLAF